MNEKGVSEKGVFIGERVIIIQIKRIGKNKVNHSIFYQIRRGEGPTQRWRLVDLGLSRLSSHSGKKNDPRV